MLALSLFQPWASLMAGGKKRIETRSWPFGGKLPAIIAIHATKTMPAEVAQMVVITEEGRIFRDALAECGYGVPDVRAYAQFDALPMGAVVAIGRLVECVATTIAVCAGGIPCLATKMMMANHPRELSFGDYAVGRYAWVFDQMHRLPEPIPARGSGKLWQWEAPASVQQVAELFLSDLLPA